MNFPDFITQDEIDDLPEDPEHAFAEFVRIAQGRLRDRLREIPDDRDSYHEVEDARHGFMNATLALAKRFRIQGLADMEVPRLETFREADFRQFQRDVDFYLAQLMIGNTYKARSESVKAYPSVTDRIRRAISDLREVVVKADLPNAKRDALLSRLDELETELTRKRLRLWVFALFVVEILRFPGELAASAEAVGRVTSEIWHALADARSTEQNDKPSIPFFDEKPVALLPPRAKMTGDEEDEIPF